MVPCGDGWVALWYKEERGVWKKKINKWYKVWGGTWAKIDECTSSDIMDFALKLRTQWIILFGLIPMLSIAIALMHEIRVWWVIILFNGGTFGNMFPAG